MRPLLLAAVTVLGLLLAACGTPGAPDPDPADTDDPKQASMDIDEAKAHYSRVLEQIRAEVQCDGETLTWRESEPESIDGTGTVEEGRFSAYVYRSPLFVADTSCHGEDFQSAVAAISRILEASGGIRDDVVLDSDDAFTLGGQVKWLDVHGASFTFASEKATVLSMVTGELPGA